MSVLKKLECSFDTALDFPLHDGGRVIFQRELFIKKTADRVLQKGPGEKFYSHYWRAPFGSGKSVFLKMIGRELQKRGCEVYLTSAASMEELDIEYFSRLGKKFGTDTVVILIDEVQGNLNSKHWIGLLKGAKPSNLLVLGVGIPKLTDFSPQFDKKYPKSGDAFPMFLTAEDLPEVFSHFNKTAECSPDIVAEVCERLLEYTSGHMFPFVTFAQHLFDPANNIDLVNIDVYLSSKVFDACSAYDQVRERCYSFLGDMVTKAEKVLLNQSLQSGDIEDLEKFGVWNRVNGFVSPLMIAEVLKRMRKNKDLIHPNKDVITLEPPEKRPYAEQIICAGLRDMTISDFEDALYSDIPATENAIGYRWFLKVQSVLPNVWGNTQVRTKNLDHAKRGAKPTIDFLFNGRVNLLGVELTLNDDVKGVDEHLKRFSDNYKCFSETGVVFHIVTLPDKKEDKNPVIPSTLSDDWKNRIYTFVKTKNALYRGSTLIRSNVVNSLSTPALPVRTFSTLLLRRVNKFKLV